MNRFQITYSKIKSYLRWKFFRTIVMDMAFYPKREIKELNKQGYVVLQKDTFTVGCFVGKKDAKKFQNKLPKGKDIISKDK